MKVTVIFLFFTFWVSQSLAKPITYKIEGQEYEGYVVNKGQKAPFLLLVHDWDGLTDYEMKRADQLGKLGYSVMAVDIFGKGVRPTEDKDRKQHTGALYKDREKMRRLLKGALDEATKLGLNTKNAAAFGYCFGGAAVLELARSGADYKAYVSFHGGLETPEGQNYKNAKGEVLVFHGTADTAVPMTDFANLANELEKANVNHEMIAYGGAPHAFTVINSSRYHKEADEKSWARFTSYLKEKLK